MTRPAPRAAPMAHVRPDVAAPARAPRVAASGGDPIANLMARVATVLASPSPPVVMPHLTMQPKPKPRVTDDREQEEQAPDEARNVDDNAETDAATEDEHAASEDESTSAEDVDDRYQYPDYYDGDGYRRHRWRRPYY